MSDIVFILGAGASADCGAPLMNSFLKTASNLLWSGKVSGDDKSHFKTVFEAIGGLQIVHSKSQLDLENIESIFTALEMAQIIQKLPGTTKEPRDVISSLIRLITRTLELSIKFPLIKGRMSPTDTYKSFSSLLNYLRRHASPIHSTSVITFNYDIGVDVAMNDQGWEIDYRLSGPRDNSAQIQLLKLHGSLNWATQATVGNGETRAIQPLRIADYVDKTDKFTLTNDGYCTADIGSNLGELMPPPWIASGTVPVIVPPAWNKSNHHATLTNVWSAAAQELSEARYVFVIGYSLPETDAFFKLLYALGSVGNNPLSKFVVFNPDPTGQVDNRFKSLLGAGALAAYEYRAAVFSEAILDIYGMFPGNVPQDVRIDIQSLNNRRIFGRG